MAENYPQAPAGKLPTTTATTPTVSSTPNRATFPYPDDIDRIKNYEFYDRLLQGQHFDAFNIRISSELFGKEYAKMRYIVANFPGLISRIIADLLFVEPPKIKDPDGDTEAQKFIDALVKENNLRIQGWESELTASSLGDTCFKLRVGKRHPNDSKPTVIIEAFTPKIYFPKRNPYNVKEQPLEEELSWLVTKDGKTYLRKEIHTPGKIENKAYEMEADKIGAEVGIGTLIAGIPISQNTQIAESLIVHIPNYRSKNDYFGNSDYQDLETLFFAINNRITKVDNILDLHSDPILALPKGILDENGKVKRSELNMFERPEDATQEQDPQYITWDANLQTALEEVEKLMEITFMMSETAPAILGLDKGGQAESGRALKFKLLRTLAKAQRKQLYYTSGLAEIIYRAELLAKAFNLEVGGVKFKGEAKVPEIVWSDGLPNDLTELIDIETKRIDAGLTSVTDSIMRIDDVDEETAKKKAEEIRKETELMMPQVSVGKDANSFNGNGKGNITPKPKPNEAVS